MVDQDHNIYINDILKCIKKIKRYVKSLDFDSFVMNEIIYDAVIRNLEIIGEASNKIPKSIQKNYDHIEWRKISGLRNILIHNYSGIDDDIILDVIKKKLPVLEKQLKLILKEENSY